MERYLGQLLGGRYEVLNIIGIGGMAVVYRARCQVLNRFVAIKILKDEFSGDEEFRRRFYHESLAVAQLSHANIVSVYDVAQSDDVQYIVMELIDGITLKDYMHKKGHLSWQETLFFAEQISKALDHAHARGIIHQDIKPHNVVLLSDGTAKVADFGIARFESTQETRVIAQAIGSVHYISPEQARGSTIDQRTDLYALGIVMYEMLTGKVPFDGDTVISIIMQHLNAVPKLPSELNPDIPRGMDDVVMHAMSPVVSHRYTRAREIFDDLEQLKYDPSRRFTHMQATPPMDETMALPKIADIPTQSRATTSSTERAISFDQTGELNGQKRKPVYTPPPRKRSFFQWLGDSPFVLIIIAAVAFALISIGVFMSMFGKLGDTTSRVAVPDLLGQQIEAVLSNSEYTDTFDIVQSDTQADSSAQNGEIIWQSLDADSMVASGAVIEVIVCENPDEPEADLLNYLLPNFVNYHVNDVVIALLENDVDDYELIEEPSFDYETGYVIRTEPEKSTLIQYGDVVTVYVSSGLDGMMVEMPSVLGYTVAEATTKLSSMYLTMGTATIIESEEEAGTIVEQSVDEGSLLNVNTVIDVRISSGAEVLEEEETEDDTQFEFPDSSEDDTTTEQPTLSGEVGRARFAIEFPDSSVESHLIVTLNGTIMHEYLYSVGTTQAYVELNAPIGEQELIITVNDTTWTTVVPFTKY